MDVSVPLRVCDSSASSSVLEDRGRTRSSGQSIGVVCPRPLAVTVIWCVLMSFLMPLSLSVSHSHCTLFLLNLLLRTKLKSVRCSRDFLPLYIFHFGCCCCLFRALLLWTSSVRSLLDSWCWTYLECLLSWSRLSYWCCDDWHIYPNCSCVFSCMEPKTTSSQLDEESTRDYCLKLKADIISNGRCWCI